MGMETVKDRCSKMPCLTSGGEVGWLGCGMRTGGMGMKSPVLIALSHQSVN